ncbi:MAG: AsnC family transcriptional regulator [archaeon]
MKETLPNPIAPVKLDNTDRLILAELQQNCMLSSRELGSKVGIPSTTAHHRRKRLEATGVISGYHAKLNPNAVGLNTSVLILIEILSLHLMMQEKLSVYDITHEIGKLNNVSSVDILTGDLDILVRATGATDWEIGRLFIDQIRAVPGINRTETLFIGLSALDSHELSIHESVKKEIPVLKEGEVKLDNTDRKILAELQQNCMLSSRELGSKLNIPPTTVHHRRRRLETNEVIIGYHAKIVPGKIGLPATAFIFVSTISADKLIDKNIKLDDILKALAAIPNITQAHILSGKFNIVAKAHGSSEREIMKQIIKEIIKIPGIERTQTYGSSFTERDSPILSIPGVKTASSRKSEEKPQKQSQK